MWPAWGAGAAPTRKPTSQIEAKLTSQLSVDEKHRDVYAALRSNNNGYYHYEKKRIVHKREIRLPQEVMRNYNLAVASMNMGLFTEINRAWICMDKRLYIWDYEQGDRYALVNPIHSTILTVALVRPRKNIFAPSVKYILAVATKHEVALFTLNFEDGVQSEMTAKQTEFSVPTDGRHIVRIVSTSKGRIFMCGEDGNVYEFDYGTNSVFSRQRHKCRKINRTKSILQTLLHFALPAVITTSSKSDEVTDVFVDEREAFDWIYVLTKSGTIRSYKTTDNSPSITFHNEVTNVVKLATSSASSDSTFRNQTNKIKVVRIVRVSPEESQQAACIALTNRGDRIFLNQRLKVLFVRVRCPQIDLQPGFGRKGHEPSCTLNSPKDVQPSSIYSNGMTVLCDNRTATHDLLIFICRTYKKDETRILELVQSEKLDGTARIRAIAEIPRRNFANFAAWSLYSSQQRNRGAQGHPLVGLNTFTTDPAYETGRRFAVLSGHRLDIYEQTRAVDELAGLLLDKKPLEEFVKNYGPEETLAMLLVIATESRLGRGNSAAASAALVAVGGGFSGMSLANSDRGMALMAASDVASVTGSVAGAVGALLASGPGVGSRPAQPMAVDNRPQPFSLSTGNRGSALAVPDSSRQQPTFSQLQATSFSDNSSPSPGLERLATDMFFDQQFSNPAVLVTQPGKYLDNWRLQAAFRYFSRLIRAVWQNKLCHSVVHPTSSKQTYKLRWPKHVLARLLEPLRFLEGFIGHHKSRIARSVDQRLSQTHPLYLNGMTQETELLDDVLKTCRKTVEGFYVLLKMAEPHRLTPVFARAESELKRNFAKLTFHDLINSEVGRERARAIIRLMIECDAEDQKGWVDELHRTCPSFFNNSDLLSHQAKLSLSQVSYVIPNDTKNNQLLETALNRFKSACEDPGFDLANACLEFSRKGAFTAAVDLALHAAQHRATEQGASTAGQAGAAQATPNFGTRQVEKCWLEVWKVLKMLGIGPASWNNVPCPVDMSTDTMENQRTKVLQRCLASRCNRFLDGLFRIFFSDGDKLEHLFAFPNSRIVMLWLTDSSNFPNADQNTQKKRVRLTLRYFNHTKQFREKVEFVNQVLARQHKEQTLELNEQISLLTEAQTAVQELRNDPHFVYPEINYGEKIAVAKIQQQILRELRRKAEQASSVLGKDVEQELKHHIFHINQLYKYSHKNQLWGCALECLAFAEQMNEQDVINRVWQCLIMEEIKKAGFGVDHTSGVKVKWVDAVAQELGLKGSGYIIDQTKRWMFPVHNIVSCLEEFAVTYPVKDQDVQPVLMMRQLGVDWPTLLAAYEKILQVGVFTDRVREKVLRSILLLVSKMYTEADLQSLKHQLEPALLGDTDSLDSDNHDLLDQGRHLITQARYTKLGADNPAKQELEQAFEEMHKKYSR